MSLLELGSRLLLLVVWLCLLGLLLWERMLLVVLGLVAVSLLRRGPPSRKVDGVRVQVLGLVAGSPAGAVAVPSVAVGAHWSSGPVARVGLLRGTPSTLLLLLLLGSLPALSLLLRPCRGN